MTEAPIEARPDTPAVDNSGSAPSPIRELGIGVISFGWMGRLHTRAYASLPERYPELRVRPRLVAVADPVQGARSAAVEQEQRHVGAAFLDRGHQRRGLQPGVHEVDVDAGVEVVLDEVHVARAGGREERLVVPVGHQAIVRPPSTGIIWPVT